MKTLLPMVCAGLLMTTSVAAIEPELHGENIETITHIATGADHHDWRRVRSAMSDTITADYTRLFGGEASNPVSG